MEIKQLSPMLMEIRITYGEPAFFFLSSDWHYDNPKCLRDKLHRHLDITKEKEGHALCFGDFFCFMQGKYDPRSSKKDIRPEHKVSNYIDAVIDDTAELLKDYPILMVSKGNHESSLLNRLETDVIDRYVDKHNQLSSYKTYSAGYHGFVKFVFHNNNGNTKTYLMYFHHGLWGGAVMKGFQANSRYGSYVDADFVISGHCFDDQTEILTDKGWISYTDITKQTNVATMNLETQALEFQQVNSIHIYDDYKELTHVTAKGVDILTTSKHGMVYLDSEGVINKCTTEEFINKRDVKVFNSCKTYTQSSLDIEDKYLKLVAWIVSDASIKEGNIRFHFKKQRKIDRVVELLTELNVKFTIGKLSAKGTRKISVCKKDSVEILNILQLDDKNLSDIYYILNSAQCELILNEYRYADGHSTETHDSYVLYSNNEKNLSILQSMCIKTNRKSTLYSETEKRGTSRLNVSTRNTTYFHTVRNAQVPYEGKVWCVNVNNGTLVVRRNGCVVITQNTHDRHLAESMRYSITKTGKLELKPQYFIKSGTYKEEYLTDNGWAIEKLAIPKNIGGWFLEFTGKHRETIDFKISMA